MERLSDLSNCKVSVSKAKNLSLPDCCSSAAAAGSRSPLSPTAEASQRALSGGKDPQPWLALDETGLHELCWTEPCTG